MFMDIWTNGQHHAIICPLFKNGHIHTVIKFHQYFSTGYQVMAGTRFVYTKLA